MSRSTPGGLATAAAALALLVSLSGCGGSDAADTTGAEPSSSTAEPAGAGDLPDEISATGDDLLAGPPQSAVFEGTDAELTWRLPATYEVEDPSGRQASSNDGDVTYSLTVGAKAGADRRAEADSYVADSDGDVASKVVEITVGETAVSVVTADTDTLGSQAFFFSAEGSAASYAVLFFTSATTDEVPAERLEELYQVLGSLEVDGQPL